MRSFCSIVDAGQTGGGCDCFGVPCALCRLSLVPGPAAPGSQASAVDDLSVLSELSNAVRQGADSAQVKYVLCVVLVALGSSVLM